MGSSSRATTDTIGRNPSSMDADPQDHTVPERPSESDSSRQEEDKSSTNSRPYSDDEEV